MLLKILYDTNAPDDLRQIVAALLTPTKADFHPADLFPLSATVIEELQDKFEIDGIHGVPLYETYREGQKRRAARKFLLHLQKMLNTPEVENLLVEYMPDKPLDATNWKRLPSSLSAKQVLSFLNPSIAEGWPHEEADQSTLSPDKMTVAIREFLHLADFVQGRFTFSKVQNAMKGSPTKTAYLLGRTTHAGLTQRILVGVRPGYQFTLMGLRVIELCANEKIRETLAGRTPKDLPTLLDILDRYGMKGFTALMAAMKRTGSTVSGALRIAGSRGLVEKTLYGYRITELGKEVLSAYKEAQGVTPKPPDA